MRAKLIPGFLRERFANPEAAVLIFVIGLGALGIIFLGKILTPVLAGLVIAFLCEPLVSGMSRYLKFPRNFAVGIVFFLFMGVLVIGIVGLLPMLWRQLSQAITEFPDMIKNLNVYLLSLPQQYPDYVPQKLIDNLISNTSLFNASSSSALGKVVWTYSMSSISGVITALVYLFLVPLAMFFFLKDKRTMLNWLSQHLPAQNGLLVNVGQEMNLQLGNYVRGKFIEIVIVGLGTYAIFWFFGLNYAALLASLVGISVMIPYVGMVLVTIPVFVLGFVQWGMSDHFIYMFLVYLTFQALDGNLLVPLLFSEAVNLHPIAIIVAILVFGGIWGFWGLFFAIPLATLVKTLINAWIKAGDNLSR